MFLLTCDFTFSGEFFFTMKEISRFNEQFAVVGEVIDGWEHLLNMQEFSLNSNTIEIIDCGISQTKTENYISSSNTIATTIDSIGCDTAEDDFISLQERTNNLDGLDYETDTSLSSPANSIYLQTICAQEDVGQSQSEKISETGFNADVFQAHEDIEDTDTSISFQVDKLNCVEKDDLNAVDESNRIESNSSPNTIFVGHSQDLQHAIIANDDLDQSEDVTAEENSQEENVVELIEMNADRKIVVIEGEVEVRKILHADIIDVDSHSQNSLLTQNSQEIVDSFISCKIFESHEIECLEHFEIEIVSREEVEIVANLNDNDQIISEDDNLPLMNCEQTEITIEESVYRGTPIVDVIHSYEAEENTVCARETPTEDVHHSNIESSSPLTRNITENEVHVVTPSREVTTTNAVSTRRRALSFHSSPVRLTVRSIGATRIATSSIIELSPLRAFTRIRMPRITFHNESLF